MQSNADGLGGKASRGSRKDLGTELYTRSRVPREWKKDKKRGSFKQASTGLGVILERPRWRARVKFVYLHVNLFQHWGFLIE